jgi:sec-independent protein translocase protein TatA
MIETMNHPLLAFGLPSGPDMIVISILVLVLFGAKKLPVFARSLGRSMGEFRKAKEEFEHELHSAADDSYNKEKQAEKRIETPKVAEATPEKQAVVGSAKAD